MTSMQMLAWSNHIENRTPTQCVSWSPQLTLKFYVWVLKMSNISYIMFVRKEAEKHLYNYYGFIKIIHYNEFKWLIIFRYMTNMFKIWTIVNLIHVIFLFFHNEPHFFSFFFLSTLIKKRVAKAFGFIHLLEI